MLKCIIQLLYSLFASHYTLLCQYTVYLNGNLFVTRNFSSCLYLLVQNTVGTLQNQTIKRIDCKQRRTCMMASGASQDLP